MMYYPSVFHDVLSLWMLVEFLCDSTGKDSGEKVLQEETKKD